jgi:hypothetical protein
MRFKAQMVYLGMADIKAKDDETKIFHKASFIDSEKEVLTFFIPDKLVEDTKKLKELQSYKVKVRLSGYNNAIRTAYEGVEA